MTEIQQTNVAVAEYIISEMHKEAPFDLVLDPGQTGALHEIACSSDIRTGLVGWIEQVTKSRALNGTGVIIRVQKHFIHEFYNLLATYIAKQRKSA